MRIRWLQHIERAARAGMVRALSMLMPMPRKPGPPDWGARPFRLLYLRYNAIGDMIMATGVMRAIAQSHSTLTVDVLASPLNAPVLARFPYVRHVIALDRRSIGSYVRSLLQIWRARYDVVIDGMAAVPKPASALLMLVSRAPYRIGIARERTRLYTLPVQPKDGVGHHIEYMAILLEPLGVQPSSVDLRQEISLSDDELAWGERQWRDSGRFDAAGRSPRLLVNVSAGRAWRRWPDERFEAVVRALRARHPEIAILVIGDPKESQSVQRVAAAAGGLAVRGTIRDAFALVATADLVFTPDTSISHAAAALHTPAVVMIPRHISDFAPYHAVGRNVFSEGENVLSIEVDRVMGALESALAEFAKMPAQTAT